MSKPRVPNQRARRFTSLIVLIIIFLRLECISVNNQREFQNLKKFENIIQVTLMSLIMKFLK